MSSCYLIQTFESLLQTRYVYSGSLCLHVQERFVFLAKTRVLCLDMNRFNMLILVLQFMFLNAKAQSVSSDMDMKSQDVVSNFHPSLAVVIGILSIMFSLTFVLLLYAKFCHRASSAHNTTTHIVDGLPRARSCVSGIDKTVIESLPFFRFSSLRGSREGLECAVCLSKFEDLEILRLLPKCKHAFHIDCIDQWLEKHSSCPLCRHRVSPDDLSFLRDSTSLRYLRNQSELRDDSNLELYVEREENRHGSSRFSIGSSFRKSEKAKKEEELPIQQQFTDSDNENNKVLHKFNHKIIISDVVLKNRWSNVSSSDLLFLNSEMLIDISSNRFSSLDANSNLHLAGSKAVKDGEMMNIKEEMERKRQFESKFSKIKQNDSFPFPVLHTAASESQNNPGSSSKVMNPTEKRSMSEITVHPRFTEFNTRNISTETSLREDDNREERRRRLWLPIARRTVQWFVNRERRSTQAHNSRQSMNV